MTVRVFTLADDLDAWEDGRVDVFALMERLLRTHPLELDALDPARRANADTLIVGAVESAELYGFTSLLRPHHLTTKEPA